MTSDGWRDGDDPAARRAPILVTGAAGFIGAAVVRALRARGAIVRAFVRAPAADRLADWDEVARGDMRDRAAVAEAMCGVGAVFHIAADYRLWARDPREIGATNVEGARIVMEEALRARVGRVVYTSSVATLGRAEGPAVETDRLAADEAIGAYKRSKILAEHVVETLAAREGLPVVIVHPSTPVGPRDRRPTPTGRIVLEAARGRIPAFVDTGLNVVHVDDVAQGHLAAFDRGRIGERYILGGENVALSDLLAAVAACVGRSPPRLRLPHAVAYPIAVGAEAIARWTGREPLATRDGLRMSRRFMYYDDAKARRDLGYAARPWREGVVDAVDWYDKAGYLKR